MGLASDDIVWEQRPGLLQGVRRYWWLVVLCVAAGVGAGYGLSALLQTRYTASAEMLLRTPGTQGVLGEDTDYVDPQRHVVNQAQRVMSTPVLRLAARSLDGMDVETLRDVLDIDASVETDVITVNAEAASPDAAAETANAVTAAYEDVVRRDTMAVAQRTVDELQVAADDARERLAELEEELADDPGNPVLRGQADALIQQLGILEARIEQITVNASLYGSGVEYVEDAEPPERPSKPNRIRNAMAGGIFAMAGAAGLAWLLENRRRRVDDVKDPAAVLHAPLLGSVPAFDAVGVTDHMPMISAPRSAAAEAYHLAALSLHASVPEDEDEGSVILVTSAEPGDGKTVTAMNLALASRYGDRGVIVVDADARMRGLSRLSGFASDVGLKELHEAGDALTWYEYRHELDGTEDVEVLPVGGEILDPPAFFQSSGFERVIRRLREHAGVVIIDSPPLLAVADTIAIARHVDGIVLVVNKGAPLAALEEVRRQLSFVDAPLLGYIVNRADVRSAPYASYAYEGPAEPASSRRNDSTGAADV